MKISVVIPIYNVEKYLLSCVNSVMTQTYPDCEVIFVNDGSPDSSMDVLEKYLSTEKVRFPYTVINHEKNRGLSAARNSGICAATGDYLYFLDSDDMLPSDGLDKLAAYVAKYQPDFVIGDIYGEGFDDTTLFSVKIEKEYLGSQREILDSYASFQWYMMAQNKLINRKFLLENRLFFKEGIVSEDELWSFQLATCANSMAICHDYTYTYIKRGGSITSVISHKRLEGYWQTILFVKSYIESSPECNIYNFFKRKLYVFSCLVAFSVLNSKEKNKIFKEIQTISRNAICNNINTLIDVIRLPIYYVPVSCSILYVKFLYNHLQRWKFI